MGIVVKVVFWQLVLFFSWEKNQVLEKIVDYLEVQIDDILCVNVEDLVEVCVNGLSEVMFDCFVLILVCLSGIVSDVCQVCNLVDLVGQVIDGGLLDSGLCIECCCVLLGVIGVIYEVCFNVMVDVVFLCLKIGNVVILCGGKEIWCINVVMVKVIQQVLQECGLLVVVVQVIESLDCVLVGEMLKMDKYIDMLIFCGGVGLYKLCCEQLMILVIIGGIGVCYIFVDEIVEIFFVLKIIVNVKIQWLSICNIVEMLLVYCNIVDIFLLVLSKQMVESGVILYVVFFVFFVL